MGNWLPADKLPRGPSGTPLSKVVVPSGLSPSANPCRAVRVICCFRVARSERLQLDAKIKGRPTGAFPYYALEALKTLTPDAVAFLPP